MREKPTFELEEPVTNRRIKEKATEMGSNLNPPNLAVFVFDNQVYSGMRISYRPATAGKTDLAVVAKEVRH